MFPNNSGYYPEGCPQQSGYSAYEGDIETIAYGIENMGPNSSVVTSEQYMNCQQALSQVAAQHFAAAQHSPMPPPPPYASQQFMPPHHSPMQMPPPPPYSSQQFMHVQHPPMPGIAAFPGASAAHGPGFPIYNDFEGPNSSGFPGIYSNPGAAGVPPTPGAISQGNYFPYQPPVHPHAYQSSPSASAKVTKQLFPPSPDTGKGKPLATPFGDIKPKGKPNSKKGGAKPAFSPLGKSSHGKPPLGKATPGSMGKSNKKMAATSSASAQEAQGGQSLLPAAAAASVSKKRSHNEISNTDIQFNTPAIVAGTPFFAAQDPSKDTTFVPGENVAAQVATPGYSHRLAVLLSAPDDKIREYAARFSSKGVQTFISSDILREDMNRIHAENIQPDQNGYFSLTGSGERHNIYKLHEPDEQGAVHRRLVPVVGTHMYPMKGPSAAQLFTDVADGKITRDLETIAKEVKRLCAQDFEDPNFKNAILEPYNRVMNASKQTSALEQAVDVAKSASGKKLSQKQRKKMGKGLR